jgi:isocitrate/isopropylmalate dehydrogenase
MRLAVIPGDGIGIEVTEHREAEQSERIEQVGAELCPLMS